MALKIGVRVLAVVGVVASIACGGATDARTVTTLDARSPRVVQRWGGKQGKKVPRKRIKAIRCTRRRPAKGDGMVPGSHVFCIYAVLDNSTAVPISTGLAERQYVDFIAQHLNEALDLKSDELVPPA